MCTIKSLNQNLYNLSNRNIFDDGISLLAFGLCNNTTVLEELNISDNLINDEGVIAIIDLLKYIKTLKKLDLSKNMIKDNGMNKMLKYIEDQVTTSLLEYVDLSENSSSPWGVYCAIIRNCCVNSLTLVGDDHILYGYRSSEEIIKSMDMNMILHSLTICNITEKVYGTLEYHCSDTEERIYEELCASQTWDFKSVLEKKLRCYSLKSSGAVDGKITIVVKISEKSDCDHLSKISDPSINDAQSSGST